MAIGTEDGLVVQRFNEPLEEVRYDPDSAITIAEALTRAGFEARDGAMPVADALKAELIERHRSVLYRRIEILLNGSRDDRLITNANLARQLVDICLGEVF
jgi:hypothetical protein